MSSSKIQANPRRTFVYFIQAEHGGPVKIGWTYDPDSRLKTLQTASPYKLVIRFLLPGTQRLEHYLHDRFAAYRLEGEWFEAHPDMPGCLHEGGISTADWLGDDARVKLFEREAQKRPRRQALLQTDSRQHGLYLSTQTKPGV